MNKFLKEELASHKFNILSLVVLNAFLTVIMLSYPLIQGRLVDIFVYTKSMNAFYNWIILMVLLLLIQLVIRYFIAKINILKKEGFVLELNKKILDKLFFSKTKNVLAYDLTYLHSRVLQDTVSVLEFYFSVISTFVSNILLLIVASYILFRVNGFILLSLIVFFPIYTIIYMIFKEKIYSASKGAMESGNACFSIRNNIYSNYVDIKVRKREDDVKKKLETHESDLILNIKRNFLLNYLLSSIKISTNSAFQLLGFLIGGLAVLKGHITLGVFTYLIQYFSMLLNTTEEFLNIGSSYQNYRASLTRLSEILEIENEYEGEYIVDDIEHISLNQLNYKHNDYCNFLYSNGLSLDFEKSSLYAITGENGVGKSTLFMLLTGVYKDLNVEGEILFNGFSLKDLNMNHIRKNCISVMLQQTFYIGVTVEEYLSTFISVEKMEEIMSMKIFKDIFMSNEFQIYNLLNKEFDILSGGEKQLVNLFACVSKEASFYILDEPTSNIFPSLRNKVINLLEGIAKSGKIVLVSTHDKELVAKSILFELK